MGARDHHCSCFWVSHCLLLTPCRQGLVFQVPLPPLVFQVPSCSPRASCCSLVPQHGPDLGQSGHT